MMIGPEPGLHSGGDHSGQRKSLSAPDDAPARHGFVSDDSNLQGGDLPVMYTSEARFARKSLYAHTKNASQHR